MGSLFERPDTEVIALEDAPLINMGGTGVTERLLTPRREPRVQVLRSLLEEGASGGNELYTINCDVEVLHVLTGSVEVRLAAGAHEIAAGDTMSLPGREPHTWVNTAAGRTELIWVLVPAAWSGSSPAAG